MITLETISHKCDIYCPNNIDFDIHEDSTSFTVSFYKDNNRESFYINKQTIDDEEAFIDRIEYLTIKCTSELERKCGLLDIQRNPG